MKSFVLVFSTLIILCLSQNPIPLPQLSLTKVQGTWYVVAGFPDFYFANTSCYTWTISVQSSTSVQISSAYTWDNMPYNQVFSYQVSHNGSVWSSESQAADWISIDPSNAAWATIADEGSQSAFIISRTPALGGAILLAQISLLKTEGYTINSTNYWAVPNSNCQHYHTI